MDGLQQIVDVERVRDHGRDAGLLQRTARGRCGREDGNRKAAAHGIAVVTCQEVPRANLRHQHIQQNNVRTPPVDHLQRLGTVGCGVDQMPVTGKQVRQDLPDRALIVDYQNACHRAPRIQPKSGRRTACHG